MATEDRPPVRDAKRRPPPDPTIVARRLAEMLRGKAEYQARRKVHRAVATDVAAMARIANPAEARTYLTRREEEVLQLICQGLRNADVAQELHVTESTIEFHVSRVLAKLGARNRVEAVDRAVALGLA